MSSINPNVEDQHEMYFHDGLHPSDKGYERIAEIPESFFENFVNRDKSWEQCRNYRRGTTQEK